MLRARKYSTRPNDVSRVISIYRPNVLKLMKPGCSFPVPELFTGPKRHFCCYFSVFNEVSVSLSLNVLQPLASALEELYSVIIACTGYLSIFVCLIWSLAGVGNYPPTPPMRLKKIYIHSGLHRNCSGELVQSLLKTNVTT